MTRWAQILLLGAITLAAAALHADPGPEYTANIDLNGDEIVRYRVVILAEQDQPLRLHVDVHADVTHPRARVLTYQRKELAKHEDTGLDHTVSFTFDDCNAGSTYFIDIDSTTGVDASLHVHLEALNSIGGNHAAARISFDKVYTDAGKTDDNPHDVTDVYACSSPRGGPIPLVALLLGVLAISARCAIERRGRGSKIGRDGAAVTCGKG